MKIDVLDKGYIRLIDVMGNDLEVANAARVSYDKRSEEMSEKDDKLINFLWKEEHTSPFRHCVLSFEIYAPLMVARQHWKYAVASTFVDDQNGWNESSRRYITEEPEFYVPLEWRGAPENSKQGSGEKLDEITSEYLSTSLEGYVTMGEVLYSNAIEAGVAPEQARMVLPQNTMTEWIWTGSLAAFVRVCKLRLDAHAQKETREIAQLIAEDLQLLYPVSWGALKGN